MTLSTLAEVAGVEHEQRVASPVLGEQLSLDELLKSVPKPCAHRWDCDGETVGRDLFGNGWMEIVCFLCGASKFSIASFSTYSHLSRTSKMKQIDFITPNGLTRTNVLAKESDRVKANPRWTRRTVIE